MIPDILFEEMVETINGKYPSIAVRLNKLFLDVWVEGCDNGGARRILTQRFDINHLDPKHKLDILKHGVSLMIKQFNKELENN